MSYNTREEIMTRGLKAAGQKKRTGLQGGKMSNKRRGPPGDFFAALKSSAQQESLRNAIKTSWRDYVSNKARVCHTAWENKTP